MFIKLLNVNGVSYLTRRYFQALYVNNKNIKKNVRILTPVLDFKKRLANPKNLEDNLKRRKQQLNVGDLLAQWEIHSAIKAKKMEMECVQKQISSVLKESKNGKTLKQKEDVRRKYTFELEMLREDLQNCASSLDDIDEKFVNEFLSLPNEISKLTPQKEQIISSYGKIANGERQHHLAYEDFIEYYSNTAYYLKGDAAKYHNSLTNYCLNFFRKHNFVDFSNPDFAKTILIEGAGLSLQHFYEVPYELDIHHTNLMHLVGNSSMLSFLGYLIKLQIFPSYLPMQWISTGRQYHRTDQDTFSLYNVSQSSTVQIFEAGTEEQMLVKFDESLNLISQIFQSIEIHFRIVYMPANDLHPAESLSAKFEMFSPHTKHYVEVGNLKYYKDYISKRLLITHVKDRKTNEIDFTHIVSGTVCNLTKTLAIILETNNGVVPNVVAL